MQPAALLVGQCAAIAARLLALHASITRRTAAA
jgi:hypothetical protein